jgi:hypothetical protein
LFQDSGAVNIPRFLGEKVYYDGKEFLLFGNANVFSISSKFSNKKYDTDSPTEFH